MAAPSTDHGYLSLSEAGALCDRDPATLRQQAIAGRLRAVKIGYAWATTREWLDDYLASRDRRGGWMTGRQRVVD